MARLFRLRVLAVDARLIVTPAQVSGDAAPRTPTRATGARLAAAERRLGEAAASLADAGAHSRPG